MIKKVCAILAFCVVVLVGSSSLCAQGVSMAGIATDIQDRGIDRVRVEVLNIGGQVVGQAFTGTDGRYSISGIQDAGPFFNVRFSKVGRVGNTLERVRPNATDASSVLPEVGAVASIAPAPPATNCGYCKPRRCRGFKRHR